MESAIAALREYPQGSELLVVVDFNAYLAQPELSRRVEEIVAYLIAVVLEYMLAHCLPRCRPWCRDGWMWSMVRLGR